MAELEICCGAVRDGHSCNLPPGHDGAHYTQWIDKHLDHQGLPAEIEMAWEEGRGSFMIAPLHPSMANRG